MQKLTIFGRITGGGGAGRSKPAIKVNKSSCLFIDQWPGEDTNT